MSNKKKGMIDNINPTHSSLFELTCSPFIPLGILIDYTYRVHQWDTYMYSGRSYVSTYVLSILIFNKFSNYESIYFRFFQPTIEKNDKILCRKVTHWIFDAWVYNYAKNSMTN